MTPEEEARVNIDKLLEDSGWIIQDYKKINLSPSIGLGIAVREFPTLKGPASNELPFLIRSVNTLNKLSILDFPMKYISPINKIQMKV